MCKHDVIHKTGSTQRIATLPEQDRATATGNMHRKLGEDRVCSSEDMIADKQTHTDTQTRSSQYSAPLSGRSNKAPDTHDRYWDTLLYTVVYCVDGREVSVGRRIKQTILSSVSVVLGLDEKSRE